MKATISHLRGDCLPFGAFGMQAANRCAFPFLEENATT
jgi:hypothetical protein